jgi:hypothetical protein
MNKLNVFLSREPDYSKDSDIDKRIIRVCAEAEADYLINKSMGKNSNNNNRGINHYDLNQRITNFNTYNNFNKNNYLSQSQGNSNNNNNDLNNIEFINKSLKMNNLNINNNMNNNMNNNLNNNMNNNMNNLNLNNNMNNNNIKIFDETSDLIQKSIFQNKNEQNNPLQNPMNNPNLYNNSNNEEISNFNNLNYQSNPNYESINSQNKNLNYQTNINFDNTNNQNFQSQNPQNTNFKELNYNESNDIFQNMNLQNINFQNFNQSNENFQNLNSRNQNNKNNNELNQIPNYTNTFNSTYTENNPDLNKYPLNLSKYNKTGLKNIISKYNTKNLKPILNKNNRKRIILPHQNHVSSKSNIDVNKLLLNTKSLIKNYKFKTAYEKLKSAIHLGIYHSDLFYLYGEVNRILKNYQESEDYLLLSLNFELHSPYVFYSLGLLYQEVSQYKYSNTFFKLFNQLLNNADVHFQMAKNYSQLGKFIKAAEQLTKAIELNKENPDYYKFRSQVYNLIGLTEMAFEDQKMFNYIINSIKEEES